ncbi:hypothetical protein ZHAS_00014886 [Anopheles sinensis]|uniref:Uncharacterized protein n=1 Tax=Anopheles sinensis TaxID=74873 RepID=A0A084W9I7_ANOSI|nr:hypothetical protein ZHAS_00014886 [Anopheles sinensis]
MCNGTGGLCSRCSCRWLPPKTIATTHETQKTNSHRTQFSKRDQAEVAPEERSTLGGLDGGGGGSCHGLNPREPTYSEREG